MKFIEVEYIFALVVCFIGSCTCISNGSPVTSSNEIPYQAAVLCPVIMCSGAIVSSRNVLTTASCVNSLSPNQVEVHVGSNTYYSNGYTFSVSTILPHPNYASSTYDKNIAILTVATSFNFQLSSVQPIPLATTEATTNSYLTATAFGATDPSLNLPDYLQKVSLQKFSQSFCQQKKNNRLTASMICAGDMKGKKDLCPADQGAPLAYRNELFGIYSWGCSCSLANPNPSTPVFTSIVYLRTWIQSNIITP